MSFEREKKQRRYQQGGSFFISRKSTPTRGERVVSSSRAIFKKSEIKKKYPIQILSPATHQFIGNSFVPVERLRNMASRPTIEISPIDAKKRKIDDGDLCKVFNDVGETFAHAIIKYSMLEGVASTQKQYRGSLVKNGLNVNALNTQDLTDMGDGPIFYTVMAQIKKI